MDRLISCIMPTWNRRHFVPLAIRCFRDQTYPHRELIIVADGEPVGDLIPPGSPNIKLITLSNDTRCSIGAKFNLGIQAAQGDVLALWADDDYHGPGRLAQQIAALDALEVRIIGSDDVRFADLRTGELWRYEYIPHSRTQFYLVGGTMMFTRAFWSERPFEDRSSAEDNAFIFQRGEKLGNMPAPWYVASMHDHNTSPKPLATRLASEQWTREDLDVAQVVTGWWWEGATG